MRRFTRKSYDSHSGEISIDFRLITQAQSDDQSLCNT
jgi:hypothetical protein